MFRLSRRAGPRLAVDATARSLAGRRELEWLTENAVRARSADAGFRLGGKDAPGVRIGESIVGNLPLWASGLDTQVDIWGPRRGKTTARVVPAILDTWGPVLVTSTKRDVLDLTRGLRRDKGGPIIVFDPHGIAETPGDDESDQYCWDPLAWVNPDCEGGEVRAAKLASHFAFSVQPSERHWDAAYLSDAEDLLAGLFLAAAVDHNATVRSVWEWVTNPSDMVPVQSLREHGRHFAANSLASQYNQDYYIRERVFGFARRMVRCLRNENVHSWVTPAASDRAVLDEREFLQSHGTIYALTDESHGSAAPLVSALAEAVIDTAMRLAGQTSGGRLRVPLLAVFDDAAHTTRWRELPTQYSRFGEAGIYAMTMLQSWSQGVRCWGADGMTDLWQAADLRIVGSGLDDIDFAQKYFAATGSTRRFCATDLLRLPRGRIVIVPTDNKPVLARTIPWWESEYAEQVRRNIRRDNDGDAPTDPVSAVEPTRVTGLPSEPDSSLEEIRPPA
ncbi:TraM recognition domain-containing protein [Nocardia sp. NPDC051030]|uniref:type IV secretory system conjugative DNA transfer family protein n=1 Tax=Nocardia sp. NPDC051030 TaxID=3155162 RepID=UPI0034225C82